MSYQLFDVNEYKGDFSTTLGMKELRLFLSKKRKTYKDFYEFILEGASLITNDLMKDVNNFINNEKSGDVKKTVSNLKQMLTDSSTAVFITSNPEI
jgi:hypothetical protein|tara:strand:- start:1175 stop:1462 length:288 start_codon:yes stop_codon:yes gene_type:complete